MRKRETLGRFRVKKGWIREQHLGVTRLIRRSFFRSDPIFASDFFKVICEKNEVPCVCFFISAGSVSKRVIENPFSRYGVLQTGGFPAKRGKGYCLRHLDPIFNKGNRT